jgi:glycosyltransferase involved in cell wall biosynthesis
MTICLFTDSMEPSGMGEHMLALADELRRRYQVLFVCPRTPRGQQLLERAARLGCVTLGIQPGDEAAGYQKLSRWLRRMKITLFHCHAGIGWEGHQGIRVARDAEVPVVVRTEHLPFLITDSQQRREYEALMPAVDQYICVSAEAYASHLAAGIPESKLSIVRNGIATVQAISDREGLRRELGLPRRAKIVLTVARMSEQKGHRFLLEAIPYVVSHLPDAHFLWVGDGPLESALRARIEELPIDEQRLILAGWREDVPRLLASSDLFVLPSLFEGLPIVVLEAMAAGLPIVATEVCGTREAIEDEVTGRLVEAGNVAALSTAVIEALSHPAMVKRWRIHGKRRFAQLFSAERMGRETMALYAAALGRCLPLEVPGANMVYTPIAQPLRTPEGGRPQRSSQAVGPG